MVAMDLACIGGVAGKNALEKCHSKAREGRNEGLRKSGYFLYAVHRHAVWTRIAGRTGVAWRSDKNPGASGKGKLPPSERQFIWAKTDREVTRTQFHVRESHWASKTRKPDIETEAQPAASPATPAWMNYRSRVTKAAPLYFRTKAVEKKKPK